MGNECVAEHLGSDLASGGLSVDDCNAADVALHKTPFAATSSVDLGFHNDRAIRESIECCVYLCVFLSDVTLLGRYAVVLEKVFGLVFVDVHSIS